MSGGKVRYAVVGSGWIAQEAFMPGVHGASNAEMTAIVSGSPDKARTLADFHGIEHVCGYDRYDELLRSGRVDAVYVALPNSLHADYAIRAARAGVHALVEKPLATSLADAEAMIAAAEEGGVFLMTAYRLHNDPATLAVLEAVRRGDVGEPRAFSSHFSFQSDPDNHRLDPGHWGGPLQDLGVYCVNMARQVFADEPLDAVAVAGSVPDDPRFAGIDGTVAATLRFPRGRIASFFASFGAAEVDTCTIVGSEARLEIERAYGVAEERVVRLIRGGDVVETRFPAVDDFAGQAHYFSECILEGRRPEPDGEEGLADVRALLAIEAAARSGRAEAIDSPPRAHRPEASQRRAIPRNERRLLV